VKNRTLFYYSSSRAAVHYLRYSKPEIELLSRIKSEFKGVGSIRINQKDLSVSSFKDLTNVIVPHLENGGRAVKIKNTFFIFFSPPSPFVYSKEGRFSFI